MMILMMEAEFPLGIIVLALGIDCGIGCMIADFLQVDDFRFLNPIWVYKNIKVNIFGTIFLTVLFNIIILPYALIYWFYKLCTVGRHDEKEK